MEIGKLIHRPGRALLVVAAAAAGAGAAVAVASVPDSSGVIHACVALDQAGHPNIELAGNVKIIDPSAGQNCVTTGGPAGGPPPEQAISWNTVGPQGPPGQPGQPGPPGPEGHTLTLNGQTFTISGVNGTNTITANPTIAPLSVNPSGRPVASMALNLGGSQQDIEIYSWSFGVTHVTTGGGGGGAGSGKVSVHEIQITKQVDKSSPLFFKACVSGQHFKTVTLTLRKAGKPAQEYLTITMKDVFVSSYQQSNGGGGGKQPVESLSLNFTKLEYKYTPQKP
jgi:type VI secretion system secreted protein Hcp